MWYCRNCIKWHHDSVSILKHLQICNATDRPPSSFENDKLNNDSKKKTENSESAVIKCTAKKKLKSTKIDRNVNNKVQKKTDNMKSPLKNCDTIIPLPNNKKTFKPSTLAPIAKKDSVFNQFMVVDNTDDEGLISKIARAYVCKFCCFKFQNKNQLDMHLKSHEENSKHSCHLCGFIASTFSALMSHYVKHSRKKAPTEQFLPAKNKVSPYKVEKKEDIQDKVLNSFSCKKCKKQFDTRKSFRTHYCPPEDKKTEYICAYCRQVTTTVEEYRDHIQSHTPPLIYTCENCPRKFGYKFQLKKHLQVCLKPKKPPQKRRQKAVSNPTQRRRLKPNKSQVPLTLDATDTVASTINSVAKLTDLKEVKKTTPSKSGDCSLRDKKSGKEMTITSETIKQEESDNIHLRLRPKKVKVVYASESSPEDNSSFQPTRRSARLGSRKHMKFSRTSSDSETEDINAIQAEINLLATTAAEISPTAASPIQTTVAHSGKDEIKKYPDNNKNNSKESVTLVLPKKRVFTSAKKKRFRKQMKKCSTLEINRNNILCCNLCSLNFRSIGSLKRHRKMHSGKPQFVCQFCGKFFYRRDIHRRHEGNVHQNTASVPFNCYYCKKNFETSSFLKEHVLSSHSGKALHPERIRRCTPALELPQEDIVIKTEPNSTLTAIVDKADESLISEPSNIFLYKCGTCDITFERSKCVFKHFDEAHNARDDLNIVRIPKSETNLNSSAIGTPHGNTHENIVQISAANRLAKNLASKTPPKIETGTFQSSGDVAQDFCVLCFSRLPEGGTGMCCEVNAHKAIDWYQCSICSVVGHRNQMQEHMLKHTKKIGTFIVNVHDINFKEINRIMEKKQPEGIVSDDELKVDKTSEQTITSIQTLIREVSCNYCNERIVDSNLLFSHPCLQLQEGIFSCYAKDCDTTSYSLSDIQNHLRNSHCFQITVESLQEQMEAFNTSCGSGNVIANDSPCIQDTQQSFVHTYEDS